MQGVYQQPAKTNILLLGAGGQVGQALRASRPDTIQLLTPDRRALDLTHTDAIAPFVRASAPALVINCAAYNFVDKAEQERDLCERINAGAVQALASVCDQLAIPLVHFSTDYVFPGQLPSLPLYTESACPGPVNHYGRTKYAGEQAAASVARNLVLRVSWVFSEYGANMGSRMLAAACAGNALAMATDQWGSPTYAGHIAETLWALIPGLLEGEPGGLYHLSGLSSSSSAISRWQLASALIDAAQARGLVPADYRVSAITQSQWQQQFGAPAAIRPDCSAMANDRLAARLGQPLPDWREGVCRCVAGFQTQS